MILEPAEKTIEEKPEQEDEEKKQPIPEEEIKAKHEEKSEDVVGMQPVSERKNSLSVGAELNELAGKSSADQQQVVVKGESSPPAKLQEQLANDNIRREQQKIETKSSKISEIEVVNQDQMLKPFEHEIRKRTSSLNEWLKKFDDHEGGIVSFAESYKKFGLNKMPGGIQYREWAPCARKVCLCGDFNGWNRNSHECKRDKYGVWELFIPNLPDGSSPIKHGSKVKTALILSDGKQVILHSVGNNIG